MYLLSKAVKSIQMIGSSGLRFIFQKHLHIEITEVLSLHIPDFRTLRGILLASSNPEKAVIPYELVLDYAALINAITPDRAFVVTPFTNIGSFIF